MVPRNAPKTTLGANWFEDPQKVFHADTFLQSFGATWAILGAILDPAGRQGAPKIELFGAKSRQNVEKWGAEWGIKKDMKFWLKFNKKM